MPVIAILFCILLFVSCNLLPRKQKPVATAPADTILSDTATQRDTLSASYIHTGNTSPQEVVSFAQTLIGTPYVYASTDPAVGFDCSGFITYVFNHFNIQVPRSSVDFTNIKEEVPVSTAKTGDLILFTGTDSTVSVVGHMGIVVAANKDSLSFIHSSSGKAMGVTITPLNEYYKGRFVKTIRIFPQNN
jgi:cell wall-associated NlpC family hydrolase